MEIRQGVDIVSVQRIREAIERHGNRFLNRIFTSEEQIYCNTKRTRYEHYAARFAAKEAAMKAMEIQRAARMRFRDIEVRRRSTGQPFLHITRPMRNLCRLPSQCQLEVSMAHEREFAVATVVLTLP